MSAVCSQIIVVCFVVVGGYWILTARSVKSTKRSDARISNVLHNGLMFLGIGLAWPTLKLGALDARFVPQSAILEIAGVALVVAGVALAIWSRQTLGANWSASVTIKTGHSLISRGPYAVVRNPIYAADIIMVLGMAVALGEVRGLLGLALMVGAAWHKARSEERFLLAEFGDEYAGYRRDVGFLLPRILARPGARDTA
jgi:protein-S-isoprenylcysteine O-methyltransferase Ste14